MSGFLVVVCLFLSCSYKILPFVTIIGLAECLTKRGMSSSVSIQI